MALLVTGSKDGAHGARGVSAIEEYAFPALLREGGPAVSAAENHRQRRPARLVRSRPVCCREGAVDPIPRALLCKCDSVWVIKKCGYAVTGQLETLMNQFRIFLLNFF